MLSRRVLEVLARRWRVEIIRTLKAYPDRDFTINELARAAGSPTMTTWRAVKDLKKAGFIKTRKVGKAIAVSLSADREMLRLMRLIPDADPHRAAALSFAERMSQMPYLVECRLFGSVGRGDHGPGEEVDVAVVYDETATTESDARAAASAAAQEVLAQTNIPIAPLCVAKRDMDRKGGIAAELREKESIWRRRA